MVWLEFDAAIDTEERILKPPLLARHDGQLIPSPGVRTVHPGNRLGRSLHLNLTVAVGEELLLVPKGDGQKLIIFSSGTPASGHLLIAASSSARAAAKRPSTISASARRLKLGSIAAIIAHRAGFGASGAVLRAPDPVEPASMEGLRAVLDAKARARNKSWTDQRGTTAWRRLRREKERGTSDGVQADCPCGGRFVRLDGTGDTASRVFGAAELGIIEGFGVGVN